MVPVVDWGCVIINRPFYSSVLTDLALDWKRGRGLGSVHYFREGGWQMGGGGQARFTPLFRGVRKVLLRIWAREGGGGGEFEG